jgi:hypothetical protein
MTVKSIIALAMCLLFQWTQVSGVVDQAGQSSVAATAHCDCCDGVPSCPCATDDGSRQEHPQLPIQPDTLNVPVVKPSDPRVELGDAPVPQSQLVISHAPQGAPVVGYAGVRLSVAFCSFVI